MPAVVAPLASSKRRLANNCGVCGKMCPGIVNGVARLVTTAGRDLRYTETGRVQSYMIGFFGGVVVLAVIVIAVVTFAGK